MMGTPVIGGSETVTADIIDLDIAALTGTPAQTLASLHALLPAALGAGGGLKVDGSGTALPVSPGTAVTGPGNPVIDSYASAAISAVADTANQVLIAAPGADKQIWVYGLVGTADTGDGSISLQDADDTASTGVMEVTQRGGFAVTPTGNFAMPWLKLATNKALEIDTVTCGFKGVISYAIVSV